MDECEFNFTFVCKKREAVNNNFKDTAIKTENQDSK